MIQGLFLTVGVFLYYRDGLRCWGRGGHGYGPACSWLPAEGLGRPEPHGNRNSKPEAYLVGCAPDSCFRVGEGCPYRWCCAAKNPFHGDAIIVEILLRHIALNCAGKAAAMDSGYRLGTDATGECKCQQDALFHLTGAGAGIGHTHPNDINFKGWKQVVTCSPSL